MLNTIKFHLTELLTGPVRRQFSTACEYASSVTQKQLAMTYKTLVQNNQNLPSLHEAGFKVFSQTDEDGILLFVFSVIGTLNQKSVEICAGDGVECNTANLIINHGWTGFLVDGDPKLVKRGQKFYRTDRHTYAYPPIFANNWITRDNVNNVIKDNGFEGEIDLLVIDLDGIDYWVWQAIDVIQPRVVVVEYNDILGPEKALTTPYSDQFNAQKYPTTQGHPNYCGASLTAFNKLAKAKGYRLIGCNRLGYNAFFIRRSIGEIFFPEIDPIDCFRNPKVIQDMQERFETVKDLPWVAV